MYQSLVEALTLGRIPKRPRQTAVEPHFSNNPPTRHLSQESVVSNPAMLHSGMLIKSPPDEVSPEPEVAHLPESLKELLSPQPNRPAPVLKPAVSKKPSIDKSFLAKKQMIEDRTQSKPTYEETLRKCQSLTRNHSYPVPLTPSAEPQQETLSKMRQQNSSPKVPPKPQSLSKVMHLPPTGQHVKLRASLHHHHLNQTFLQDLHRAMASKLESEKEPKFPKRLSSGEYENVAPIGESPSRNIKVHPRPPLPKRSEETHLTWRRS